MGHRLRGAQGLFRRRPRPSRAEGLDYHGKGDFPELNEAVALAEEAGLKVTVPAEEGMQGEDPRTYRVLRLSPARRSVAR